MPDYPLQKTSVFGTQLARLPAPDAKLARCTEDVEVNPCEDDKPSLKVTITWTDTDVTKVLMGITWTNGETKLLCPGNYDCINSYNTFVAVLYPLPSITFIWSTKKESWNDAALGNFGKLNQEYYHLRKINPGGVYYEQRVWDKEVGKFYDFDGAVFYISQGKQITTYLSVANTNSALDVTNVNTSSYNLFSFGPWAAPDEDATPPIKLFGTFTTTTGITMTWVKGPGPWGGCF